MKEFNIRTMNLYKPLLTAHTSSLECCKMELRAHESRQKKS